MAHNILSSEIRELEEIFHCSTTQYQYYYSVSVLLTITCTQYQCPVLLLLTTLYW